MPIQLHCDLQVAPGHEAEIERVFNEIFSPVMARQQGFVEVKFLKLITSYKGNPDPWNYRLIICFTTEELRQAWVATAYQDQVLAHLIEVRLKAGRGAILLKGRGRGEEFAVACRSQG